MKELNSSKESITAIQDKIVEQSKDSLLRISLVNINKSAVFGGFGHIY